MKKRLLMAILCLTLSFSIVACGDNGTSGSNSSSKNEDSSKDDDSSDDDNSSNDKESSKKDKDSNIDKSGIDDSNWVHSKEFYDNLSIEELMEEIEDGTVGAGLFAQEEISEDLYNEVVYYVNVIVNSMKNDEDEWIEAIMKEVDYLDEDQIREELREIVDEFDEEMEMFLSYDSFVKYVNKSYVSSDMQLCDTIRTAVATALYDPYVIDKADNLPAESGDYSLEEFLSDTVLRSEVEDILGCPISDMEDLIKSQYKGKKASEIRVIYESPNQLTIYIKNSCKEGLSGENCEDCKIIYAGPYFNNK